jgi:hypothetical protein
MPSSPSKPDAADSWYFSQSPNAYRSATFPAEKSKTDESSSWHFTRSPNAYRSATIAARKSEESQTTKEFELADAENSTAEAESSTVEAGNSTAKAENNTAKAPALKTIKAKMVLKGSTPRVNADGSKNIVAGVRFNPDKLEKGKKDGKSLEE